VRDSQINNVKRIASQRLESYAYGTTIGEGFRFAISRAIRPNLFALLFIGLSDRFHEFYYVFREARRQIPTLCSRRCSHTCLHSSKAMVEILFTVAAGLSIYALLACAWYVL
jgi:hypothetical protein